MSAPTATGTVPGTRVWRFEVRPSDAAGDPKGAAVRRDADHIGLSPESVRTARVYLVLGPLDPDQAERVRNGLLTDPVLERSVVGATDAAPGERVIEVHPLPGVMDPAAQTVRDAIRELAGVDDVEVITGWRYDVAGVTEDEAARLAADLLSNAVVEQVHLSPWSPDEFPHAAPADQTLRHVELTTLDDPALERLSRDGHLFLSLDEMRAIQAEYQRLGREPTDIELETLAQTWSEHCVHKTLKSTVRYTPHEGDVIDWSGRPGHEVQPDGSVVIHNLLKSTVAAATFELIDEGLDWTLSVFVDNAGIIKFDDDHAVCVKVETHNHPSAIEPYGGAATGVGGCIRDIMGTGLAAKPIANTDVFCVATPWGWGGETGTEARRHGGTEGGEKKELPAGCLHPRRVLTRVIDGVRDYGNRMGIPTVNGTVWFDDRFIGNPLVFCGCVGVMPAHLTHGDAQPGDRIVALGGRTGRDGIHGATFSSAELTDTHADEFSHAVQIGNPIEEKRTLDAILRARDAEGGPLYTAITDCGAGGFSSAVGEMGEKIGAEVELASAPLKYAGLRYDEIWISESQERMVLAVPAGNIPALQKICDEEHVELADLGVFGTPDRELVLRFEGVEVGRMSMEFLHDGIPMPTREAHWKPSDVRVKEPDVDADIKETLLGLLADPNIASKRWIVRQYDHEVQGNTLIKPLVGEGGIGPGDAAVIQPVPGSRKGLAIACGLQIPVGDPARGGDPYLMALAAVDECVRNLVCVGANPERIAILDNFCWPSCAKPENLGSLVRAAEGCYDAAKAYKTPFVSGKDSLNNQFRREDGSVIEIPPTLLISGIGVVEDVEKCVTMDLKPTSGRKEVIALVGRQTNGWRHRLPTRHSMVLDRVALEGDAPSMEAELKRHSTCARQVASLIDQGLVLAAHDCSEGGALVAIAEMIIAGRGERGVRVRMDGFVGLDRDNVDDNLFAWWNMFLEQSGMYVLQATKHDYDRDGGIFDQLCDAFVQCWSIGDVTSDGRLSVVGAGSDPTDVEMPFEELERAFLGTLDW